MKPPFRIKICGITNVADARQAADAGADAIGLNFYAKSPRSVTPEQATEIAAALPASNARVGVFVNETAELILKLAQSLSLDWIQLHGDEPPTMLAELAPHRVIRAFRCSPQNVDGALTWLELAEQLGHPPAAILVDAFQVGQFGGTGKTVDVTLVARFRDRWPNLPLILAGGLTPDNVTELIRSARPDGVDTASGVEASPGKKDGELVTQFVRNAGQGLQFGE